MNPSDQARQIGVVDSWLAQYKNYAATVNPAGDTVLADTGALAAGFYDVVACCSANVALGWDAANFEWRNAANNGTLWQQGIMTAGADFKILTLANVKLAANERLRFRSEAGLTGCIWTSIIAIRRA